MRILTVCRSGGIYRPEHVERIRAQCERFAPGVEFRCLSDMPVPGQVPLVFNWPGWWAKLEVFRFPGPCLYMDLDTTIVSDLTPLLDVARKHEFVALHDFNPHQRLMGSGLMAWSGDMSRVFRDFAADPERHMAQNKSSRWLGDQGFLERRTAPEFWQELLPGAVVSWKKHCRQGVPPRARVVCFHGLPKPWGVGQ